VGSVDLLRATLPNSQRTGISAQLVAPMDSFARRLDALMTERGLGVRAVADRVPCDPSVVSRLRRGLARPSPRMARGLDLALGAGGELIALASQAPASSSSAPMAEDLRVGQVAPELVDYFRGQLPGHYQADMFLGPLHLIPTVQTQAELIIRLAKAADATVRRGLLGVGTAYTALLGWLYQDAGDLPASAHWRDVTLGLAHRAGDPQLVSYALTNKAMLAVDYEDGHAVVDFTQAALIDEDRLCPKVRVLALQHQAHGFSMLRDRAEADRLLDTADTLTGQADDDYPWGNACHRTPAYMAVQRATCYGRTGRADDATAAAALWDQILDTSAAGRDNAVFHARQAAALAEAGETERVTSIAADAAGLVHTTGSARLRRELLALPRHVRGWKDTPAGEELGEIIASIA
jgi:transcriptional regulator with XRE-family HTH domain